MLLKEKTTLRTSHQLTSSLSLSLSRFYLRGEMASRPLITAVLLLVFLNEVSLLKLIAEGHHDQVVSGNSSGSESPPGLLDCAGLCGVRCSRHSRPNVCARACGTCCDRCGCVPPGTFGNRDLCGPCYANMTTHSNRTKCP